jgi:hypothetical protein
LEHARRHRDRLHSAYDAASTKRGKAEIGQAAQTGNYDAAAKAAFAIGDLTTGVLFSKMAQDRKGQATFDREFAGLKGGAAAPAATGAGASAPAQSDFNPASIPSFVSAAGSQYGISPDFMNRTAWIESKGNPRAVSPTGAKGLYQFTGGTAANYGLSNPFDPAASADAAARLAADNKAALAQSLGRDPTDAELYLAHQQGAGGAAALLANPDAPAVDALARAYGGDRSKAARAIAVNGGNPNMRAADFAALWTSKYNGLGPTAAAAAAPAQPRTMAALGLGGTSAADLPAAGAQPAQFTIPPAAAANADPEVKIDGYDGTWTRAKVAAAAAKDPSRDGIPEDNEIAAAQGGARPSAPSAPSAARPVSPPQVQASAAQGGLRLSPNAAKLIALMSLPGITEGQKESAKIALQQEIEASKQPEEFKKFLLAQQNPALRSSSTGTRRTRPRAR